jgi:hypothetical protein
MTEETAAHQIRDASAQMRRHELWRQVLFFLVDEVEKQNMRAWVRSDMIRQQLEYSRQHASDRKVLQRAYFARTFGGLHDRAVAHYLRRISRRPRNGDSRFTGSHAPTFFR